MGHGILLTKNLSHFRFLKSILFRSCENWKPDIFLLKFCIVWKFSSCFYCKDQLEFFAVKPYEIQIDCMVNVRGFLVSQKVMRIVTGLLCSRNLKWFLVPVCVFFHRNQLFFFLWRCGPTRAMASSFLKFLDHTQLRITVGRTPLDEWSARRRDLYLTTHNIHNRQTSVPPVGFEPMISAGERPQTYALHRAATGTGTGTSYSHTL